MTGKAFFGMGDGVFRTFAVIGAMFFVLSAGAEDIPVDWVTGQTPASLADGKLTLTYAGTNVATLVAAPEADERIVLQGDPIAFKSDATITMADTANGRGALVFTTNTYGFGRLYVRPETDDSEIFFSAADKTKVLDKAPNWTLMFPGKKLSEYEPVESDQRELGYTANQHLMTAYHLVRGKDDQNRDTLEFQLQYENAAYGWIKSLRVRLRQGTDGIEGVVVETSYVDDLPVSVQGTDMDYLATHRNEFPKWKSYLTYTPTSNTGYGVARLTMRRISGLPLVLLEKKFLSATKPDRDQAMTIDPGVEVKGAGGSATGSYGGRTVNGVLTHANNATLVQTQPLSGSGTIRYLSERTLDDPYLEGGNLYCYASQESTDNNTGRRLDALTNVVAKLAGGVFGTDLSPATFCHFKIDSTGYKATGQLQALTKNGVTLGCLFVEFEQSLKTVKMKGVKAGLVSAATHEIGVDFDTLTDVTWTNVATKVKLAEVDGMMATQATLAFSEIARQYWTLRTPSTFVGTLCVGGGSTSSGHFITFDKSCNILPTNGVLRIENGGYVGLFVSGDEQDSDDPALANGYSKGTCDWVVKAGGTIGQAFRAKGVVGKNQTIDLQGGTFKAAESYGSDDALTAADAGVYLSRLTFSDGALLTGYRPVYAGHSYSKALWTVRGTSPSSCDVDIKVAGGKTSAETLAWNVLDVTGYTNAVDTLADFTLNGALRRFDADANHSQAILRKYGSGTVRLNGPCAAGTAYDGLTDLVCGTWLLGADDVVSSDSKIQLSGGTLAAAENTANDIGTLSVTTNGTISVATGAVLRFADSHAVAWTNGVTVVISGDLAQNTVRFGTDANGLTATQQRQLRNAAGKRVVLDENGWLRDRIGMVLVVR